MRSNVPSLPSEEGVPGKKGQSLPVAVRSNPSPFEPRGVEHTLPRGEELAGFTQALLPLSSGLTPPCGQVTTPGGIDTHSVNFGGPHRAHHPLTQTGVLTPTELTVSTGGEPPPPGSDGAAYSHQGDYGPLEAEDRLRGPPLDQFIGQPAVHHVRGVDGLPQYGEKGWGDDWCPPPWTYRDNSQRWLPPWHLPRDPDSAGHWQRWHQDPLPSDSSWSQTAPSYNSAVYSQCWQQTALLRQRCQWPEPATDSAPVPQHWQQAALATANTQTEPGCNRVTPAPRKGRPPYFDHTPTR